MHDFSPVSLFIGKWHFILLIPKAKLDVLKVEKKMNGKRNGEGGKRWKSRASTGRCLPASFFVFHTGFRGLSPAWVCDAFFRTEGPGHGFGFEMASNWFFETGKSSNVLTALLTGDALLEGVQVKK